MTYSTARSFPISCLIVVLGCASTDSQTAANDAGSASGGSSGASGSSGSSGASSGGSSGAGSGGSSGANGGRVGSTGGAVSGDAAADVCPKCGPGNLCVEHQTEGGALILADAGRCPPGRVPSGSVCNLAPSYECAPLPAECTPPPGSPPVKHCICARSLCGSANQCTDISPTLMKCTLQAP